LEDFENDKKIVEELIKKYSENEADIIKANYSLPQNIIEIKYVIAKIENNFKGLNEYAIYKPEIELVMNYGRLFSSLSILYIPLVSMSEYKFLVDKYYELRNLGTAFWEHKNNLFNAELNEKLKQPILGIYKSST
jgi:hypothetical protein